jgi:hypothetical protein
MTGDGPAFEADLAMAIRELRRSGAGFVIVKAGEVLDQSDDHGVLSLVDAAQRLREERVAGAALADRVLGRSAVLVALWAGIRAAYGETASEEAQREAQRHGLAFSCGRRVPMILNRPRTGMCPFEAAIRGVEDPAQAVMKLRAVRPKP